MGEPAALDAGANRPRHRDRIVRARDRARAPARRRSRAPSPAPRRMPCRSPRRGSPAAPCARGSRRCCRGCRIPMPLPIGEPSGMIAAQPTSSSRRARIGSSVVYGSTTKPSSTSRSAAASSSTRVGQQRLLVADHLQLDPARCRTPRARAARSSPHRGPCSSRRCSAARRRRPRRAPRRASRGRPFDGRLDSAQRHGDHPGTGDRDRFGQRLEPREAAACRGSAATAASLPAIVNEPTL